MLNNRHSSNIAGWLFAILFALSPTNVPAAEEGAKDDAPRLQIMQQALDLYLTQELATVDTVATYQRVAFLSRMLARQAEPKPTLAVLGKYWDNVTNSARYDAANGGFYTPNHGNASTPQTKTLLDQALISEMLLDAVQITGHKKSREAAKATLDFVLRDLRLTMGGFATADKLPNSPRDETMHPSSNGLIVAALARGYVMFDNQDYYSAAVQTEAFLLTRCVTADDVVAVIHGALTLYQVAGEARWLAEAIKLQDRLDQEYWDEATTQYHLSASSLNSHERAIMNLLRLHIITDDDLFRDRGHALLTAEINKAGDEVMGNPALLCAIDQQRGPNPHLIIVGDPTAVETRALFTTSHRSYQPRLIIVAHAGDPIQAGLRKRFPAMVPVPAYKGKPSAYMCIGMLCHPPTNEPARLEKLLAEVPYR